MTFEEFLKQVGKRQYGQKYATRNADGSLDIKATALQTYSVCTNSAGSGVKDYAANSFMRNTVEWNDAIKKASQV
jgi:hypothetical protein